MEFPQSLSSLVNHSSASAGDVAVEGPHTLSRWDWSRVERLRDRHLQDALFGAVVNEMGRLSAQAQQLKQIITTAGKFSGSRDRIYLHVTLPNTVNGILRVGEKKLFIRDEAAAIKEITPSCVLDFYVSEARQRTGYGRQLFEFMLRSEKASSAARFGYDRPSPKLLGFLAKHYGLSSFVPQNNNYVVFRKYFSKDGAPPSASGDRRQPANVTVAQPYIAHAGRRTGGNVESSPNPRQQHASHVSRQPPPPQREPDYSSFAHLQASPPPGQASFSHFDPAADSGRALQYDDEGSSPYDDGPRGRDVPSGGQDPYPSYSTSGSRGFSSSQYEDDQSYGRAPPSESSRLARAGSNMLSTSSLHTSQSYPSSSQSYQPSHISLQSHSHPQQQRGPPRPAAAASKADYNPNFRPRVTQYHTHNPITNYQQPRDGSQGSGHSSFANQKQPAQFLPDGMSVAPEIVVDRRTKRSGIQPRPLLDPTPQTIAAVSQNIDRLEQAIRDKEAALAQPSRFAIPYRTPSERDAGWSKAASYQRMADERQAGAHPTSYPTATGASEQMQYSHPGMSSKVGGGQSVYSNPNAPPPVAGRSPFAYGAVGQRR